MLSVIKSCLFGLLLGPLLSALLGSWEREFSQIKGDRVIISSQMTQSQALSQRQVGVNCKW